MRYAKTCHKRLILISPIYIDAYNRDRQLITASLSNRLDLGQNSLPGAQQVRVAVKHTDQISEFPEHLR